MSAREIKNSTNRNYFDLSIFLPIYFSLAIELTCQVPYFINLLIQAILHMVSTAKVS